MLGSAPGFFSFFSQLVEELGWQRAVADIETAACREPGALEGGTHVVVAVVVERI
jgi:hypothetical protein